MAQHNLLSTLLVERGARLNDKHLKINYFMMGIQCADFDMTKTSLRPTLKKFVDFILVKDHFIECQRLNQASKYLPRAVETMVVNMRYEICLAIETC